MKTAIVHDWLITFGGAERVFKEILDIYPDADIFCLMDFLPTKNRDFLKDKKVTTSILQKFPYAKTKYRNFLLFMPYAIEQFDLTQYDLIISSSHAVAHGVLTNSEQVHISYFNNTMVYAWDLYHYYLKNANLHKGLKGLMAKWILHYIRNWDTGTAHRVDRYIANSQYMARRIDKLYGYDSHVIYPPVDIDKFKMSEDKKDYFIVVSRLVPFKRIDIVVDAFTQMPDKKLIILGDGPELKNLKKMAGQNIEFLGFQNREVVNDYLRQAKAFIFSSVEPFGIAIIEAQACGTPVIAYRGGAAQEIIKNNENGLLFEQQNRKSLIDTVNEFEKKQSSFDPQLIKQNAKRFSKERFQAEFKSFVEKTVSSHFNFNDVNKSRQLVIKRKQDVLEKIKEIESDDYL